MSDKKPVAHLRLSPVAAAIWKNQTAEGKAFYSVTFSRTYKDKAGAWQHADSFSGSDLLLLSKLADQAHTKTEELRKTDGQADDEDAG